MLFTKEQFGVCSFSIIKTSNITINYKLVGRYFRKCLLTMLLDNDLQSATVLQLKIILFIDSQIVILICKYDQSSRTELISNSIGSSSLVEVIPCVCFEVLQYFIYSDKQAPGRYTNTFYPFSDSVQYPWKHYHGSSL